MHSSVLRCAVLGLVFSQLAQSADEHIRVPLYKKPKRAILASLTSKRLARRQSGGLCSNFQASSSDTECAAFSPLDNGAYYGTISLGTSPVQTFNVTLDSGSSDLWIYSATGSSVQPNIWVPTASKSGSDIGKNSSIQYGDGSQEAYEWWNETVTFGGITATGVIAGAADIGFNNITASDVPSTGSGLLGVGWPALNTGGYLPFIQVAVQQGLIKSQLYGFYAGNEANSTNGELTLGSIDATRYTGELNYHTVLPYKNSTGPDTYEFFNVNVTKLTIGDSSVDYTGGEPLEFIVDTGTSFLVLPQNVIDALVKDVDATLISNSTVAGGYSVPCENLQNAPAITFVIDGTSYVIPGNVWTHNDPTLAEAGVPCFAELYSNGDGTQADGFFGDTFFRQYYTVFDFDNKRVGFALSATANATIPSSTSSSNSNSGAFMSVNAPRLGFVFSLCVLILLGL